VNLFRKLTAKSWLEAGLPDEGAGTVVESAPGRAGLWMFLAVVTSLFSLFCAAYLMRMRLPDWQVLAEPGLLWFNTVVLAGASATMQFARNAAKQGKLGSVRSGLTAGGILTLTFLAGQLIVWQQLTEAGYFAVSNPAYAFFYLLTGVHALHLAGGLWVWGKTTISAWRDLEGDDIFAVAGMRLRVELCTTYWHYLLLVWLVLFVLLLRT